MEGYRPFANQGGVPPNTDPALYGDGNLSYLPISQSPGMQQGIPVQQDMMAGQQYAPPQMHMGQTYSGQTQYGAPSPVPSSLNSSQTQSTQYLSQSQTQSSQYLSQAQYSDFSDQSNGHGIAMVPSQHSSAALSARTSQSGLTHTVMESYTEQHTAGSHAVSHHPSERSSHSEALTNHVEVKDDMDSVATGYRIAAVRENGIPEIPSGPSLPAPRPNLSENLQASCPLITAFFAGRPARREPLRITSLKMDVKCHVATAFVDVDLMCQYPDDWKPQTLQFFMPKLHSTTITNLKVENLVRPKVFATVVVPAEEVRKYGWHARQVSWDYDKFAPSNNDPELFVLELFKGQPGDIFKVTLTFFHPLMFDHGNYYLRLPCTIPSSAMDPLQSINDILDIHVTLNSGLPVDIDFSVESHPYTLLDSEPGHIELRANNGDLLWTNNDFLLSYKMWGRVIVGACCYVPPLDDQNGDLPVAEGTAVITNEHWLQDTLITDKPPKSKNSIMAGNKKGVQLGQPVMDTRGTFCLTVAPPSPEFSPSHVRSCIFILDRSGSMTGEPMEHAIDALCRGLEMLSPNDQFTVVAFDHEQMWWSEVLQEATQDNVEACSMWVRENVTANGLTDIWGPLGQALNLLTSCAKGLPYVFLITDGCVENEREICVQVKDLLAQGEAQGVSKPRVCTFGIGPFCNHYFLKQLATIARGSFDVAFRPDAIKVQIEQMLSAAAHPVLSDLTIQIKGLENCELYPYPIPDLFSGQPLLVAGKFSRHWPRSITLQGKLPGGKTWTQTIESSRAHNIPLDQVFTKTHLDYMTAIQWLNGQEELLQRIVDLSVASGVPCYHTQMVGAEMSPQRAEELQAELRAGKRPNIVKYAIGGVAGVGVVAGVTAALVFGDLGATLGNLPIGDAFNAFGDLMSADCCECCGTCCEICTNCIVC